MDNKLSFTISKYSLQEINDNQLAKLRLWIVSDGNNRHNMPISLDTIKQAAFSLVGKPVLYKYSARQQDFLEHEPDEIPCGVFLEDCNIQFVPDEENKEKTWLVADAIIWKYYCPEIIEVFQRDQEKSISMEIQILDSKRTEDNMEEITSFVFLGVTLLGSMYSPAIPNAKAKVLKFSELVEATKKMLGFAVPKDEIGKGEKIPIDLSKEAADMDTPWGEIDKIKLRDTLLRAKNYKELVNACYLVVEDGFEENQSSKLKYPVCRIKDGKLVLSKSGCQVALSFLEKNTNESYYESAKRKLKKYYKVLGLDIENFNCKGGRMMGMMGFDKNQFAEMHGLTANEMWNMLSSACHDVTFEQDGEMCQRYWMQDHDDMCIYALDEMTNKMVAIPYEITDTGVMLDLNNIKPARLVYEIIDEGDGTIAGDDVVDFISKHMFNRKTEKLNNELKTYKEKLFALENENNSLKEKLSILENENNELKTFKANIEEQERKMKIEFAINSVADDLTPEQIEEWRNKANEFETVEEFSNAIKAFAYSITKTKKDKSSIVWAHIPIDTNNSKENKGLWDRL